MTRTARGINSVNLILKHATRLFLTNGYRNTTVEQIATATQLSKGAVYFHFSDKAALALQLLQRAEEQLENAITMAMAGGLPQDRLVRFLHQRSLLAKQRSDYWLLTVMFSVEFAGTGSPGSGAIKTRVKKVYQLLDDFLEQLITAGMDQGQFCTELPAREQAAIIVATHDGMLLQWRRRSKQLNGEYLVRAMRRSVLLGLGADLSGGENPTRLADKTN